MLSDRGIPKSLRRTELGFLGKSYTTKAHLTCKCRNSPFQASSRLELVLPNPLHRFEFDLGQLGASRIVLQPAIHFIPWLNLTNARGCAGKDHVARLEGRKGSVTRPNVDGNASAAEVRQCVRRTFAGESLPPRTSETFRHSGYRDHTGLTSKGRKLARKLELTSRVIIEDTCSINAGILNIISEVQPFCFTSPLIYDATKK